MSWSAKERGWEPKAKGPFRIIGSEAIQADAAEATAALAYLVWTASIKDEPLFDEGVYAGLNQLFLSDAGRDARSDLRLESHLFLLLLFPTFMWLSMQ